MTALPVDPAVQVAAEDAAWAALARRQIRRRRRILAGVLLAVVALLASLAVPNLLSARINRNESMVTATLKNISSAQAQCQASCVIDENGNGQGEYGFFAELAGGVALPNGRPPMSPPALSKAYAEVVAGRVHRGGYLFEMVLPDRQRHGVREGPRGGRAGTAAVEPSEAETLWACYAWPAERDWSGRRAFFMNQYGDVLMTNGAVHAYDGTRAPMRWDAAFAASAVVTMASPVAANAVGNDGNTWTVG